MRPPNELLVLFVAVGGCAGMDPETDEAPTALSLEEEALVSELVASRD